MMVINYIFLYQIYAVYCVGGYYDDCINNSNNNLTRVIKINILVVFGINFLLNCFIYADFFVDKKIITPALKAL